MLKDCSWDYGLRARVLWISSIDSLYIVVRMRGTALMLVYGAAMASFLLLN